VPFLHELEDFRRRAQRLPRANVDPEALKESVDLYNGIRERIARLYALQSEHSQPISWNEFNRVIHAGPFWTPRSIGPCWMA